MKGKTFATLLSRSICFAYLCNSLPPFSLFLCVSFWCRRRELEINVKTIPIANYLLSAVDFSGFVAILPMAVQIADDSKRVNFGRRFSSIFGLIFREKLKCALAVSQFFFSNAIELNSIRGESRN